MSSAKKERKETVKWKECISLQSEMKKSLNSNSDPFRKEIEDLRAKLRSNYLYLLDEHSTFSFKGKDVLVNLWKFVFYKQIEFCRKQLRKKEKEKKKEKTNANANANVKRLDLITKLREIIIPDAKSVYSDLLNKHLNKSFITRRNSTFIDGITNISNIKDTQTSVIIAHKSLIYIGDLERYKETYVNGGNYDKAKLSYCLALQLMPTRGNPHNQLAVLHQMQINCDLAAIYRYVLSLFVVEPFKTAKENLSLLFKKTITLIDRNNTNCDELIESIQSRNAWNELQIYVIYVLGIIYQENYRKNTKYHTILHKIQPIILEKISLILRDTLDDTDDKKQNESDIANTMKQLSIISMFIVTQCFDAELHYIGYKESISWTLSLIATMMRSQSLSVLPPIHLCCLWLQKNFDFVVPDVNKSPWIKMEINQSDLAPNNAFFAQFAKLLNVLHTKYALMNMSNMKENVMIPEQTEFYGIKELNFIDFDDISYSDNTDYILIYHRRFELQDMNSLPLPLPLPLHNTRSAVNYNHLRYLKLVQFAEYSSSKIEGVLVFSDNKWRANKLLTIEEPQPQPQPPPPPPQQQQQQPQQQTESPIFEFTAIPRKQKSLDTYYHSPIFHGHSHHDYGDYNDFNNHSYNYSRSAPSSPRGLHHHHHHHHYSMQPPLIEYPENDEVNFNYNIIKSTPTTPKNNGHQYYHQTQSQTATPANDNAFNFSSSYNAVPFHPHLPHSLQPVTQPTTPVFGAHHSNNYHAPPNIHLQPPRSHSHPHSHSHHTRSHQQIYPQQLHHSLKYQQQHATHTPNNSDVLNFNCNDLSSPLFCEDIVSEVFNELQLSQQ